MTKAVLYRIAGPVAVAKDLDAKMYDVVLVGEEGLLGEVIQIVGNKTMIQVYEDTSGLKPGEPVKNTGKPLSVRLGPGMLANIYDGIQRPLPSLATDGDFISRGTHISGLDLEKKWEFVATAKNNDTVGQGDVLGHVEEAKGFKHFVLVPPGVEGKLTGIKSGTFNVTEPLCKVGGRDVRMHQEWPVREPRPYKEKIQPDTPLVTGQRVIDSLFPVAKGGTAIIPGPFGAGKTVSQQQLAKWSDADIIVYIGCGERGNEMTEVLTEFPELKDPRNGQPLMNRTVLIANTSNMPVAAREASIYTGITIAEYFRDMGYDVAIMADSTSRWAEALREISSRLEEMPGEEGYPAYLSSRLSEFYERAGNVVPHGREKASSLTVIGAVSPPGGDFFEPVTQSSLRIAKTFWALDAKLAQQRHFPSINWLESYSLYRKRLKPWYDKNISEEWIPLTEKISEIMQEENELLEIVQLVGSDALPEEQQVTLATARMIREILLQQSAFDERDAYSPMKKSFHIMRLVLAYHDKGKQLLEKGAKFSQVQALGLEDELYGFKFADVKEADAIYRKITEAEVAR